MKIEDENNSFLRSIKGPAVTKVWLYKKEIQQVNPNVLCTEYHIIQEDGPPTVVTTYSCHDEKGKELSTRSNENKDYSKSEYLSWASGFYCMESSVSTTVNTPITYNPSFYSKSLCSLRNELARSTYWC